MNPIKLKLPDYQQIARKVRRRKIEVLPAELTQALQWLQKSRAKLSQALRPARNGDFVEIEYRSPVLGATPHRDGFILGQGRFLPGFEEQIFACQAGQSKIFDLRFPSDWKDPRVAGKVVKITLTVKSVQQVELPAINDDFARGLGRFEHLAQLEQSVSQGLQLEKEQQESLRVQREILSKIAAATAFEIPVNLVDRESERQLADFEKAVTSQFKISLSEHLQNLKVSQEQLKKTFKENVQNNIKTFFILQAIAKDQAIQAGPQEVLERVNQYLKKYQNVKEAKQEVDPEKLKEYYRVVIEQEKTLKFLENLAQPLT